jgi:hypothetical protein
MNKKGVDPATYGNPDVFTSGMFYLDTKTGAVIPLNVDFSNPHGYSPDWGQ